MSMSFGRSSTGSQGTGFGTGGTPKIITASLRNEDVLQALTELTDKDFDYDVDAWRYWYKSQKPKTPQFNTRRD